jgi:hypothetical protein
MEESPQSIGELIHDTAEAVAASTSMAEDGAVVVKVGMVIDVINVDGERALVDIYTTDGGHKYASPWDAKGMLRDALDQYDVMRGRNGR